MTMEAGELLMQFDGGEFASRDINSTPALKFKNKGKTQKVK